MDKSGGSEFNPCQGYALQLFLITTEAAESR